MLTDPYTVHWFGRELMGEGRAMGLLFEVHVRLNSWREGRPIIEL